MFVRRLTHALLILGLMLGTAQAQGSKEKDAVAMVSLEVEGGAAAQIRSQVQEGFAQKLEAEGMTAMVPGQVAEALGGRPDLAGCTTPACLEELGSLLGAGRLMRVSVEASAGTYTFDIELYYPGVPGVDEPARVEDACAVCTVSEVSEQVAEAALELARQPVPSTEPAEVEVEIATEPPGAMLTIDGTEVGLSPYRGKLASGPHTVEASLQGYERAEQSITVAGVAGSGEAPQRFDVGLVSSAGGDTGARPFRMIKWAGAGVAAVSLGAGIVWMSLDGNGTCSGGGTCPEVYDTGTQGMLTLGLGVAAGAVTGWMFWRDRQDERAARFTAAPTPGGAVGAVSWTF